MSALVKTNPDIAENLHDYYTSKLSEKNTEISNLKIARYQAEKRARDAELKCEQTERELLRAQLEPDFKILRHAMKMLKGLSEQQEFIKHPLAKTFHDELAKKFDALHDEITHWIGD